MNTWFPVRMAYIGPTPGKPSNLTGIRSVANLLDLDNVKLHVTSTGLRYLEYQFKRSLLGLPGGLFEAS